MNHFHDLAPYASTDILRNQIPFERPDLETKSILVNQAGFKGLGDFKNF